MMSLQIDYQSSILLAHDFQSYKLYDEIFNTECIKYLIRISKKILFEKNDLFSSKRINSFKTIIVEKLNSKRTC